MTRHRIAVSIISLYGIPTRPVPTRPRPSLPRVARPALIATLASGVLVCLAAFAPAGALAGGPLLSGYGPPGAGAQAIIGATLLNGPSGGSGGSSSGGDSAGGSGSSSGGSSSGVPSSTAGRAAPGGGGSGRAANTTHSAAPAAQRARGGSTQVPGADGSGAYSRALQGKAYPTAAVSAEAPWFSGADLLALVLAAGALALTAVATVRLAGSQHE
jgi:hypothetical protein